MNALVATMPVFTRFFHRVKGDTCFSAGVWITSLTEARNTIGSTKHTNNDKYPCATSWNQRSKFSATVIQESACPAIQTAIPNTEPAPVPMSTRAAKLNFFFGSFDKPYSMAKNNTTPISRSPCPSEISKSLRMSLPLTIILITSLKQVSAICHNLNNLLICSFHAFLAQTADIADCILHAFRDDPVTSAELLTIDVHLISQNSRIYRSGNLSGTGRFRPVTDDPRHNRQSIDQRVSNPRPKDKQSHIRLRIRR